MPGPYHYVLKQTEHMRKLLLSAFILSLFFACQKNDNPSPVNEDPATFAEIGSIDVGEQGAAEITAYDPATKQLFVVNNGGKNQITIVDFTDPANMKIRATAIDVSAYGAVNSLAVHDGKLAAAIEAINKTQPGKVVVYKTSDLKEIKVVPVGALPDMVTFSPDGNYILSANEGEPSADYLTDPVGSVSIIAVKDNYSVTNIDFSSFAPQQAALLQKGLRIFGPNASLAQDIEPEYIAVAADSKTAWVTLQENNAIAKINITSKVVTDIFPLGMKDYNTDANAIDVSDKDNAIVLKKWKVKGMYMPDAIAVLGNGATPYLFTANEGDVREYTAFEEAKRVAKLKLDAAAFPDATALLAEAMLGRLNVTTKSGDTDGDGDFEELHSFGARSFSVWNGNTGALVFDSKNELESKCVAAGIYQDGRSDDKGVEPEGITLGEVGRRQLAFVGMERSNALAVYDVTNPSTPVFLQLLKSGEEPEGVLFISAKSSPIGRSLLVVSSEKDGVIKVYKPNSL